jgi:hypothetical protein
MSKKNENVISFNVNNNRMCLIGTLMREIFHILQLVQLFTISLKIYMFNCVMNIGKLQKKVESCVEISALERGSN